MRFSGYAATVENEAIYHRRWLMYLMPPVQSTHNPVGPAKRSPTHHPYASFTGFLPPWLNKKIPIRGYRMGILFISYELLSPFSLLPSVPLFLPFLLQTVLQFLPVL